MSRRTVVIITDDLNESRLATTTRTFALDNKAYELDLSVSSSERLSMVFEEFIAVARRVDALHPEQSMSADDTLGGLTLREYNTRMRAWAVAEGRDGEIRGKGSGAYYYPKQLRTDYAEHLQRLAADQATS